MSLPPSVQKLLAAIDAGNVSVAEVPTAVRQAGGADFVLISVIRELAAGGGGSVWGDITGTITDQTDLVNYVAANVVGLFDYKGATDASGNPNYPAALKGDVYRISVAGKVGGSAGKVVEIGDFIVALADNAGGTEASVGTSWGAWQANIDGAVVGPTSATDNAVTRYDGTTGKLVQNSNVTINDSGILDSSGAVRVDGGAGSGVGLFPYFVALGPVAVVAWWDGAPGISTRQTYIEQVANSILRVANGAAACELRVAGDATKYASLSHDGTNAKLNSSSGNLHISSLPTSNPGPGILWNNLGVPAIGT